ncbi:AMP-binding protein [Pseudolysinimonas kribbensis]|uniref:AMP-binding protein n=1 Tax=Pseudolysinimonas kribbensis TaxID=433641 RepID=A0ABQ6K388_9MICO|nr:AMP-binding protein [Pseudolysinimonas kribbensis]
MIAVDASAATDFLDAFDRLAPGWESGVASTTIPDVRHVVLVRAHPGRDALDLGRLGDGGIARDEVDRRLAEIDPDDVCDIVFTSGTTGHALGAELTHDMVLRSAYGSAYHRAFADGWRISFALPLYHVFGYVEGMLSVLFVAGAIAPLRVFNPKTVLEVIERERINEVLFVPTMTVAVVDHAVKDPHDLSSLESVFSAAAPAPVWLWERVLSDLAPRMVFTGYGQTEVSAATALTLPGDDIATVSAAVGTTKLGGIATEGSDLPDGRLAEYRTVDPFSGEVLPAGETGELSVRGPQVTRGYYGDPERTAYSVDADGWLRTGDLGHIDERGYLRLDGRSSELFKVGGELVAPLEVEQALTGMAGVSQAFVAGIPDERFGEVGWAWVVPTEDAELDEHELLRELRGHLARFKVPRGITVTDAASLPVTTTGKVQKYLLVRSLSPTG